jgi:hypothetical protein
MQQGFQLSYLVFLQLVYVWRHHGHCDCLSHFIFILTCLPDPPLDSLHHLILLLDHLGVSLVKPIVECILDFNLHTIFKRFPHTVKSHAHLLVLLHSEFAQI